MQTLYQLYCMNKTPYHPQKNSHLELKKPIPSRGEENEPCHDQTE
jgi:hypothetical protein